MPANPYKAFTFADNGNTAKRELSVLHIFTNNISSICQKDVKIVLLSCYNLCIF